MNVDISGKVIAVTGAARGIGRVLAPGLAVEADIGCAHHISGTVITVRSPITR